MESVRVQVSGNRIKAYGRIVAAATPSHPAFSASYDLVTDDSGATKRLSLTVTLAERERQLSIARDEENMWLVQDHSNQSKRAAYDGALDVDVVFSPFFNALPIRRTGLYQRSESVSVAVVYVTLPDLSVDAATISYSINNAGLAEARRRFGLRWQQLNIRGVDFEPAHQILDVGIIKERYVLDVVIFGLFLDCYEPFEAHIVVRLDQAEGLSALNHR